MESEKHPLRDEWKSNFRKEKKNEKPYESMFLKYAAIHKAIVAECDKLLIDY